MLTVTEIDEITQIIITAVNPDRIILFGSYANGSQDQSSDLDLFIEMETELPPHKRAVEIRKHLYGKIDVPKDILVYTPDEIKEWQDVPYSFVYNVINTGKVLYEK